MVNIFPGVFRFLTKQHAISRSIMFWEILTGLTTKIHEN